MGGCASKPFSDESVYLKSPCGLEFCDVRLGSGEAPSKGQRVRVRSG